MYTFSPDFRTLLIILVVTLLVCASVIQADQAVAKVNGEQITESQFIKELKARHGYAVLQTMIEALAIRQQAADSDISVTTEEVETRYQQAKEQIVRGAPTSRPPQEVFAVWLTQRSLNPQTFRERIELQIMLENMVQNDVEVTAEEVDNYYRTHQQELARPEAMQVSNICVTTEKEAEEIRKNILEGKISFAEAANKYSIDPYGRENAGLIGFVVQGEDPLQQAAFGLQNDGDLSPAVHTQMGYHIVRREAYQQPGTPPLEEIRAELRDRIYRARLLQAAQEMRQAIMKMARIEQFVQFAQPGESGATTIGD